jgi:16S rRNA processing protein RimM
LSNPPPPADTPSDFIVLATIVRPHGLKGEVKVNLLCSGLERLKTCPNLRLVKDGKEIKTVTVGRSFMHNDGDAVVRLKEVEGVDEAEALRGAYLAIPAGERPDLPEGIYYVDDLLGLAVENARGVHLGHIEEVMDGLANAVYVVRDGKNEVLIPGLRSVVQSVDLKARRMVVDLAEEVDGETAD